MVTGCDEEKNNNNQTNNQGEKTNNNTNNDQSYVVDDDEIIEFEDEDNAPPESLDVPSTLINCKDCVFASFKDKKNFGSIVTEYTKDYSTIRDNNGRQKRRFLGLILDSGNHIQKAYACGIEKGKAYCLEGTEDGHAFEYNVGILNQVFSSSECSYNTNGSRYTCLGETNGDTRKDGYVSVHYDENCHVFGKTVDHEAQIYCY